MTKALIIGIGAGDPDHVTIQAIKALNRVDVFLVPTKGDEKADLLHLRREICERYIEGRSYRFVEFEQPRRDDPTVSYRQTVEQWHDAIAERYERHLLDELAEGQCAGFLVWGDPSLYDSTVRILDKVRARSRIALDYEMIPGITSVQALTARHAVPLNRIGEAVQITTGRKLAQCMPEDAGSVVVMLDGQQAFQAIPPEGLEIFWGAYLGTEDEILIAGRLEDVRDEIARVRSEARGRKGWVMDTYLLRKVDPSNA
ncbi:precorrin-6A synthase (deacetylating) [Microvirga pudoricolor]|uniref:precorrin-6A synthase (deacetylating) n=1 Tax=Microvirga pudoricolor TaxID=2778729 RepID=UPI001951BE8C|nr:precorrin-6A synthase (deacetylating) [Microvirga pudoricolor]MBM6595158.1 precorrin-6A synthase (deacetylating) [Microvirga pudoricolor]